jgi:hypothetical protein
MVAAPGNKTALIYISTKLKIMRERKEGNLKTFFSMTDDIGAIS